MKNKFKASKNRKACTKPLDLVTCEKNEHQLINYTEIMFLPTFQSYSITDFQFRFNSVTSIL